MNAFGSYAGEEVVDFTVFGGNGLYLITGETGSGKTTIFDAISYALFGKASGGARNNYKMLRSDYAEKRVKTCVELEFVSGGAGYVVRREIIPHISRRTEEVSYTDGVSLILPDGTALDRGRDVDAKILEVVGLDREQFAQIVMIAQNDFLRFLQSGTDERVKILRRIFGTGALKFFQENLKLRTREKDDERKAVIRDFSKYETDPYRYAEQFAVWERQIKDDGAAIAQADATLGEYDKAKEALAGKIAVAEGISKSFTDLAAQLRALAGHSAGADEMLRAAEQKKRGEAALYKVKQFADKAVEAGKMYKAASADLLKACSDEKASAAAFEAAKKTLAELPPLENAQSAFEQLNFKLSLAAEKLTALTQLKHEHDTIAAKQGDLSRAQSEFEALNAGYINARATYDGLYERFLRGQAGILAQALADGAPCPVCGSVEHPSPAVTPDEDVSESKLKKLDAETAKAKKGLDGKAADCAALRAEIETLTRRFLKDFGQYAPDAEWDIAGGKLSGLLVDARTAADGLTSEKNAGETGLAQLKKAREAAAKSHSDSEAACFSAHTLVGERETRERERQGYRDASYAAYRDALTANGFADGAEYTAALLSEEKLADMTRRLLDHDENGKQIRRDIARLEAETAGKERPDLEKLNDEAERVKAASDSLRSSREDTKTRFDNTSRILKELKKSAEALVKVEKECAALKGLSDTANGKLDFETYAQTAYFERVLRAANMRLKVMSQNRYVLLRKGESGDGRRRMGLEIEVADSYTGKSRSANSLSGGESFMASLSLALGLSDVVQQSAGGIHLDAMFIDEGFGSLDAEVLELAVRTLSDMAGGNRIIGIISHVAELRERIDKQIRVGKSTSGSSIKLVV
jgi:exonuclease SbcC